VSGVRRVEVIVREVVVVDLLAEVSEVTRFVLHPESLAFLKKLLFCFLNILNISREYLLIYGPQVLLDKRVIG
jgi:hypothetical protein